MKIKWRNQIKMLNYITSTERFKIIFVISIIISLYGGVVLGTSSSNYADAILKCFRFYLYNIFIMALLFLNTLNTCSIFDKKFGFYAIRLKNKKNYLKEVIKTTLFVNMFFLLIFFLLYFISLNFFNFGKFGVYQYQNYNVNNFVYMLFYMIRYVFVSMMICSISALIFINFKEKITILFNFLFLIGFMSPTLFSINRNFSFSPWHYMTSINYPSFLTEISCSLMFAVFIEIIYILVFNLTVRNKKMVIS